MAESNRAWKLLLGIFAGVMILLSGCGPIPTPTNDTSEDNLNDLLTLVASQSVKPTATVTEPPPTLEAKARVETRPVEEDELVVASEDARGYVGEVVWVRIERAACSYRSNVEGEPTFCNDHPYPNHDFTLLVWGEDWSFLDGKCLMVEGEVIDYDGTAEIIVTNLEQVFYCE